MTATDVAAETDAAGSARPFARYASIARQLALTQFRLKYTGSALGYAWSLLKPLMIFGIMYAVFDLTLRVGAGTVNFPIQLLVAVVVWSFFAEATITSANAIVANSTLIQRAFFPRSILVFASGATAAMTFIINMLLILVIATPLQRLSLGWRSLAAIPLLLELCILILGVSLLLASLFVFFRDVGHVWEILLQVGFYASGVVFPIYVYAVHHSAIVKVVMAIDPMSQVIEDFRHALVTSTVPWAVSLLGPGLYLIPIGICLGMFGLGILVFRSTAPRFAENL